jgi:[ribosomal protein S18]-alanine N-acetyltransferase
MNDEASIDAAMAVMTAAFEPRWREAWTREQLRDSLALPSTVLLLGDRDGRPAAPGGAIAGFVLSRQALDEEELLLLAVLPAERGRGIGTALLNTYFSAAERRGVRRVFLEMRSNNPAHSLYRRCGFEPIGVRPRYYRAEDGRAIDAITFSRHLSD